MDYRMDNRSVEQFKHDIAVGVTKERDIIHRYACRQRELHGLTVTIEDNGCDNTGKLLDRKQVNTNADFKVNGVLTEVKFNNQMLKVFRLKGSQLRSYVKQGARILWVNGYESEGPLFTFITPEYLAKIAEEREEKPFFPWGGKLCYEIKATEFQWFPLTY